MVGDHFLAVYLKDAHTSVQVFDLKGRHVRDVEFPGLGTAAGFGGKRKDKETFYSFTSFTTPATIYRYDVASGQEHGLAAAQAQVRPGRLRDDTGLLPEQGRHEESRCSSATRRG